jgi:glucuronokinase
VHRATVSARAGLAGNPSDAYGGAAVAVPIPALAATVEVEDAPALNVDGPAEGRRLISAAVARLARHAGVDDEGFEVRWSTTIPREVGLAGSSALIIATMQALCARWELTIPPLELAHMALAIEVDDLGIAAGLMDRAVQAFGVAVLVDGDDARPLSIVAPPRLVVAWSSAGASPSHRVHGPLRARFDAGDATVVEAMVRLAALGRAAAAALEAGDHEALAGCVRTTFAVRVSLRIVCPEVMAMVDALEATGAAATSAGSGGAVVGLLAPAAPATNARAALAGPSDASVTT